MAELDAALDWTNSDLTEVETKRLTTLIHQCRDVFALSNLELGSAKGVKHTITLEPGATPVRIRPYRTNPMQKKIIEEQVQEMLAADVIEESRSPWQSPIVLVPKPGGAAP